MWQCMKCGQKLEDSDKVCWSCGTAKEGTHAPNVQDEATQDDDKILFCPKCGAKLPEEGERHFCPKCGIKLPGGEQSESDGAAPPLASAPRSGTRAARAVGYGLGGVFIGVICVLVGIGVGILICMGMLHQFLDDLFRPFGGK